MTLKSRRAFRYQVAILLYFGAFSDFKQTTIKPWYGDRFEPSQR
jgi:hypothetical protein